MQEILAQQKNLLRLMKDHKGKGGGSPAGKRAPTPPAPRGVKSERDAELGSEAHLADTTSDLGFLKLGDPSSASFLRIDEAKARQMMKDDFGLSPRVAEAMCLPVVCDPAYQGTTFCTHSGKKGHENAFSGCHAFKGIVHFKRAIQLASSRKN